VWLFIVERWTRGVKVFRGRATQLRDRLCGPTVSPSAIYYYTAAAGETKRDPDKRFAPSAAYINILIYTYASLQYLYAVHV